MCNEMQKNNVRMLNDLFPILVFPVLTIVSVIRV